MENEFRERTLGTVQQLMNMKRYKEALAEAEQVLREWPEDPDLLALIAHLYNLMDNYEKALYWAKEALVREPEQEVAWYVRVCVYYETDNQKELNEALQEAMRIDPYEPHYYYLKANILNKRSKYKEAKEQLLQALELRPENPLYLATLSYTEALLGNIEESARLDRVAVQYDAEMPYVLLYLAWAAGQRGDYVLKETYMKNAVRLSPDDKQMQDEFLEALQQRNKLFRIFLWPGRMLRRMKRWQILVSWLVAWLLFRPLVIIFIVLYVFMHWITKGIVHVQVFGWQRRGS